MDRGLYQREIAEEIGVDPTTIEASETVPRSAAKRELKQRPSSLPDREMEQQND